MGFLGALISGGTSLLGGILGSSAASKAAAQQQQAYTNAANYAKQNLANSLGTIQSNLGRQQGLLSPYQQLGTQATANLSSLAGSPGQGLLAPWTGQFQAPSAAQAAATPGYQFQVQQANEMLQNSAAARGGLLTGGTAKALDAYTQGLASENYGNVYNRAFNEYLQQYQQFQQNQANQYNRLSGLAGIGQWAAGTGVSALGQASGLTVGANQAAAQQVGQDITGAGAAQAAGTVGSANAWTGALSGIGNTAAQYGLLSQLSGIYNPTSQPLQNLNLGSLSPAATVNPYQLPNSISLQPTPATASSYNPLNTYMSPLSQLQGSSYPIQP